MLSHPAQGGQPAAGVIPIQAPPRAVLWARIQLAKAVLGHRPLTRETADLLLAILDGASIEDLS
jgi:hypothetical protein